MEQRSYIKEMEVQRDAFVDIERRKSICNEGV